MNARHSSVTVYPIGERPKGFVGYHQIARPAGLSVAALKKHLAAAGLLAGDEPTPKAIDEQFAIRAALPPNPTYPNTKGYRVMWARTKTFELLEAAGATGNAGFGIHNGHSASDQLNMAGQDLDSEDVPQNIRCFSPSLQHEGHFEIIQARRGAAEAAAAHKYLADETDELVALIKARRKPTAGESSALRRIEAVRAWLEPRSHKSASVPSA